MMPLERLFLTPPLLWLEISKGNHAPDDNPEKTFCGKHRPGKFQGAVAKA